jgi:ribosomal protein L24
MKIQNFSSPSFLGNLHSGDVRHRKGNCAEYVDINIKKTAESQKWAIIDVRNFNRGPLSDLNACFGFMEREFPIAYSNVMLIDPETKKEALFDPLRINRSLAAL